MINSHLKKLLERIEGKLSLSDKFHFFSNNKHLDNSNLIKMPEEWIKIHFKTYPRLQKINLNSLTKPTYLSKILKGRFSARNFSGKPMTKKNLFYMIQESAGLIRSGKSLNDSRRTYPSAGARYPLELYPIILKCDGMKKGLYHYNVKENCLELLLEKDLEKWVVQTTGNQKWVEKATVIFAITGVFDRTRIKYGERGYRYVLIETGHLGQNIGLLATELGFGSCALGGFIDSKVNTLLDINLQQESILYLIAVGCI